MISVDEALAHRAYEDTALTIGYNQTLSQPYTVARMTELLLAAGPKGVALAASPSGRQPTFGLWPTALRDDLRAALKGGLRKVVQWSDRHNGREALFPVIGFDPFFNVNTPDDLARAEKLLEATA